MGFVHRWVDIPVQAPNELLAHRGPTEEYI